ncbi:MAG: histidine kinase [Phycisphaerae bacterium]|nr:histidine kinase [Gemmatimonadaceae bacterium]
MMGAVSQTALHMGQLAGKWGEGASNRGGLRGVSGVNSSQFACTTQCLASCANDTQVHGMIPAPQPAEFPNSRRLPWIGILIAWTLWGVWSAQQSMLAAMLSGQAAPARTNPLSLTIFSASFWAIITPFVMLATRYIRDHLSSTLQRAGAHVTLFVIVHVLDVSAYWIASGWLTSLGRPMLPLLFSLVTFNGLTYAVAASVISALDSQQSLRIRQTRESQLEAQLALSQFHALRSQLHPHFLFNALNAVSSLIHSDPQRADRMLSRISDLLRTAIATAAQAEIPLMDEMEFNKRYLEVERMRYGDRLDVRIDIAGETFNALVPNMLLQPLVENAVRHGIAPYSGKGRVEVHASRRGDQLYIVVRDTGPGFDPDHDPDRPAQQFTDRPTGEGRGVGISTTRARLHKLYGDDQELMLVNITGGFEARVSVPFHVQEKAVA